ncbi:DUF1565 domain-containing protein [Microcoleus sp. FACHB-831]|uniref:DUF1565 domain-containing protein n=1 Tax=Microcoleus sp. FACHB-831 TaxID=2692827 RepID=UPI0016854293|nr:DUF1565 domain-containing protein [Microcoleus sp. FACHB-831]MBD1924061.1 DUF1565 domain-containing protein [Microcoleus sp. FACHB-831]
MSLRRPHTYNAIALETLQTRSLPCPFPPLSALQMAKLRKIFTGCVLASLVPVVSCFSLDFTLPAMAQTVSQGKVASQVNKLFVNPTTGNDIANTGMERSPFKTISQALRVAGQNTVILLSPGTYSKAGGETFPLMLKPSVTIQGNPRTRGEYIVIAGGGIFASRTAGDVDVTIVGASHAGITGLTITNPNQRGYAVWIESSSPVVVENTFTGSKQGAISVNGNSAPLIRSNYFYDNSGNGIIISGTSRPEVRDNVFSNTGYALNITQDAAPRLTGNRISNNKAGVAVEGNAQPVLRNNIIENNQEDGLVAIDWSRPDLGISSQPGGNIFRGNGRFDISNKTVNQIFSAFGNQMSQRIDGRLDLAGSQNSPIPTPTVSTNRPPVATPAQVTATPSRGENSPRQAQQEPVASKPSNSPAIANNQPSRNSSGAIANNTQSAALPSQPTQAIVSSPSPSPLTPKNPVTTNNPSGDRPIANNSQSTALPSQPTQASVSSPNSQNSDRPIANNTGGTALPSPPTQASVSSPNSQNSDRPIANNTGGAALPSQITQASVSSVNPLNGDRPIANNSQPTALPSPPTQTSDRPIANNSQPTALPSQITQTSVSSVNPLNGDRPIANNSQPTALPSQPTQTSDRASIAIPNTSPVLPRPSRVSASSFPVPTSLGNSSPVASSNQQPAKIDIPVPTPTSNQNDINRSLVFEQPLGTPTQSGVQQGISTSSTLSQNTPATNTGNSQNFVGMARISSPLGANRTAPEDDVAATRKASPVAARGMRYRVVVDTKNGGEENKVRSLVPNAFHVVSQGRRVLQVGIYSDRIYAEEMLQTLNSKALKATIEPLN